MFKLPKFKDYKGQCVRYIQAKMDGHMYHIIVDGCGSITCLTKNNKDKTDKVLAISHINEELHKLPCETEIFGELHYPGVPATSVPTMLNDADENLQLSVFACPMLGGDTSIIDTPFDVVVDILSGLGLEVIPVFMTTTKAAADKRQRLLDEAEEQKVEGWVLKEFHMKGWYKLKPVKTIDAIIIDHQESDSKAYAGCLKSVSLGLVNDDGTIHDLGMCGGGFSKKFKLSLDTVNLRNDLIDKVIEVAYQSITPGKKLQFPRFIRFRDDKDPDQCTVEQLND